MLRSSFSGEDPSDVDAGSEAATQTDRFGFILANGSSAGMGPSPELVRQREAKWISIINQWDHVLEKKNSKVKEQCQKGIPASLKAKCWPLLCGAADRMKQNKDVYQSLDSQPALQIWLDVIKRDLDRQFPFHEMFLSRDGHGQRELLRVLKAYTQYQPDEGYCQAQGPVAAVLLINMPAEEAFWCLVQISEQYLPGYYSQLLEGVLFDAPILTWVLKRACPAAHRHLQRHDVEPLMFATDWLMCLFTRHLPFNTLLRVWDLFFGYGVRVLFQVAAVLVRRVLGRAEQRRECQGQMETLERLRGIREQMKQENEDNFIAEVCSVSLSERDLNKRTEKELEKWRKERPSSTFDPRVRCHGYGAACVGVREREKERGEKEREMGNLSVPLTRSASTVSLSPSLLRKRWRKGGKAEASDWQGGGEVVRNLSMGVRGLGRETWTARRPLRVQSIQEEQHKAPKGRQNDTDANLIRPSEAEPKGDPSLPTSAPKESRALSSQEETVQVKPGKPEKFSVDVAQQETGRCDEEDRTTEKTSVEGPVKDSRPEHIIHRVEPTSELQPCANAEDTEPRCNSQLRQLEDPSAERNQEEEVENRDTLETRGKVEKQAGGEENAVSAEEKPSQINTDTESGTHTDTATQAVAGISDGQTDREPEPEAITENAQQTETHAHTVVTMQCESAAQNAVEFNRPSDAQTEEDTQEANTQDGLTPTELKEESPTPTENNRETETRESREENTEMQEQTQAATPTEEECNDLHTNNTSLEETAPEEDARGQTAAAAEKDESDFEIPAAETAMCTETDTPASTEQAAEVFFVSSENESEFPLREPAQAHEETVSDADAEAEEDGATSAPSAGAAPTETEPPSRAAGSMTPSKRALLNSTAEPGDETSKEPLTVEQVSTGDVEERTGSARENVEKTEAVLQAYLPEPPRTQESHAVDSGSCAGELQEPPPFGEHDVLPSDPELMLVAGRRAHTCSGEFRVIKASSSQRSRLLRKLSEDLFSSSQLDGRPVADQPVADQRAEEPERASQSSPAPIRRDPKQPDTVSAGASPAPVPSGPKEQTGRSEGREGVRREEKPANTPKGLGLFRRLRGGQRGPKIQIPKILIQDFSDGVRVECAVQGEEEERLSSKERRRRRRARERREKEEEKTRKKREKGLEGERRNPQTRGKSFATQSDEPASRRSSAPHTDSYF